MTIDEFLERASKPIMVYRFAKNDPRKGKSAQKRMLNAMEELDKLIMEYCGLK